MSDLEEEKDENTRDGHQEHMDSIIWNIIDSYFKDNPQVLVRHHIESYNDFFKTRIFQMIRDKNPTRLVSRFDPAINEYRSQCELFIGGKDGTRIYFGKPVIFDDNQLDTHYMFPNEARLRNMTYGMTVHYDIEVEYTTILEAGEHPDAINANANIETSGESGTYAQESDLNELVPGGAKEDEDKDKAGKKSAKLQRKHKRDSVPGDISTKQMAEMREATEKSLKQPFDLAKPNVQKYTNIIEKVYLGKFPIMVQSDYCVLKGLPKEIRYSMGECRNDLGGYFIIDGKEKTVIPQEKFADNMIYIHKSSDDNYTFVAEIRSRSENVSKPVRTTAVRIVAPTKHDPDTREDKKRAFTNNNIVVSVPNVRKPVPLFILFRALGITSDREIIEMCLLDIDKYRDLLEHFIPSVHDAGPIMNQMTALKYIATLTKRKTVPHALEILSDYFLPHIGEINYIQKAYYLGHMVYKLLLTSIGIELEINRDNYKFKRIELVGDLMAELFREYYSIQQKEIYVKFEKLLYYNLEMYEDNLSGLIQQNYAEVFKERSLETGFKKAFKGNWGATAHTKRIGVVQDINRLSFNSFMAHLRKTTLALDPTSKFVGPRLLHCTHWGVIDPIDTPDGGNIGLHKSLAISTHVTRGASREPMLRWLRANIAMKLVEECGPKMLSTMTKVFVNGLWAGSIDTPIESVNKMKLYRRNALLPIYTSISFDIRQNIVFIYTDSGRLCRPLFYTDHLTRQISYEKHDIKARLIPGKMSVEDLAKDFQVKSGKHGFHWQELITGFNPKKEGVVYDPYRIYDLGELYQLSEHESSATSLTEIDRFLSKKAILDYVDVSELETAYIALNVEAYADKTSYTHSEIHESLIFGMMCNQIIFPENNPPTRNSFSCGQSKQAVSMYHTNHQVRMDKTAVLLNSGQRPLVGSRYSQYINNNENPYGENAIVAIMCYTGYNVEDAVLINEGALKRGLFRTTYYTTYEAHEENSQSNDGSNINTVFTNIESTVNIVGTKPGYDYSKLDEFGIIRENTVVKDKTVLIGLSTNSSGSVSKDIRTDGSKTPKKGQLGYVDKAFITDGEAGQRIAKIRVREERIPAIGDKIASRAGQKGTVGLVVPEADMPFTKDGIRPDIIVNPHALPSRMTIGQLVEVIMGKTCVAYGAIGDCTAFVNRGQKTAVFGEMLSQVGFHSSGNEIMYNGMTGEQIETEIFIGPTYYMRLKHMVKDKVNFRARGPNAALTKQPVSGRANDGGLRIGEMERDSIISHGAASFLAESMMDRADKYYMAVCNTTGMLAVYNPDKNLFMSPMADGPIQFTGTLNDANGSNLCIQNITKYGRNFSVVSVPYTLKLLIQELQTVNIQMRIITEDNIQQLESMGYSKNINTLLGMADVTPKRIIEIITETLPNEDRRYSPDADLVYYNQSNSPDGPPQFEQRSPNGLRSPEGPPPDNDRRFEQRSSSPDDDRRFEQRSPEGPPPDNDRRFEQRSSSPDDDRRFEQRSSSPDDDRPFEQRSPQDSNNLRGGNSNQIQLNDIVAYKYDNTNSRWQIKDIKSENAITIQKHSQFGGSVRKMDNDIQVVTMSDIKPFSETLNSYNPNMDIPSMDNPNVDNPNTGPTINFSPIIVNGNNNKTIQDDPGENAKTNHNAGGSSNELGTRSKDLLLDLPDKNESHNDKSKDKSKSEKPEKTSGGFGSGIIDFAKGFLVKKNG